MVQRGKSGNDRGRNQRKQRIDLADIFNTLISNGHYIDDIKNKYTVDQVYMFYERCIKKEMQRQQMDAIIHYNCLLCTAQTDKKGAKDQKKHWKKFLDSLEWDKVTKEKTVDPLKAFGALGQFIKARRSK